VELEMEASRASFKSAARKAVAGTGVAAWFGFNLVMGFYTYLWRNSPEIPDAANGRVAPMYHEHVRIFFVQPWEKRVAFYGLTLSLGLLLSAVVLGLVFFRRDMARRRSLSSLNVAALAAFLGWVGYALWPLSS
jgi:hypothetical protein